MLRRSFLQTALAIPGLALPPEGGARQPVYFLVYSRFTDHLHADFALATMRAALPTLRSWQQAGQAPGLRWLVHLSGASAHAFADYKGESGMLAQLQHGHQEGLIEFGYDGSEEPTPRWRPIPNFRNGQTPESRWLARLEAAEWFLSEHKHPVKGIPDHTRTGGLVRVREVFGDPLMIAGYTQEIGRDSEYAHLFRKWNLRAVLPGTPESFVYPARNINGYSGGIADLGRLMSPGEKDVPELFWQDGFLRLSRATHRTMTGIPLCQGPAAIQKAIEALPRDRPHVLQLELGHPHAFLKPDAPGEVKASPLLWAYDNPKQARVSEEHLKFRGEWEAAINEELKTLAWLREEFFEQEPGSRFVHVGELLKCAEGRQPNVAGAAEARHLAGVVEKSAATNNHPVAVLRASGRYFSLAECYHLLARHLLGTEAGSEYPVTPMYGPAEIGFHSSAVGMGVERRVLAEALAPWLGEQAPGWTPYPANRIPAWTSVQGERLNAAQVLLLLCGFAADPAALRQAVKPVYTYSTLAGSFPTSVGVEELGAVWTVKPAPLEG